MDWSLILIGAGVVVYLYFLTAGEENPLATVLAVLAVLFGIPLLALVIGGEVGFWAWAALVMLILGIIAWRGRMPPSDPSMHDDA